jgi:hypothetical protein
MEAKLANCEIRLQAIRLIAKSHTQNGVPKAISATHGPLGSIFDAVDRANITVYCSETLI